MSNLCLPRQVFAVSVPLGVPWRLAAHRSLPRSDHPWRSRRSRFFPKFLQRACLNTLSFSTSLPRSGSYFTFPLQSARALAALWQPLQANGGAVCFFFRARLRWCEVGGAPPRLCNPPGSALCACGRAPSVAYFTENCVSPTFGTWPLSLTPRAGNLFSPISAEIRKCGSPLELNWLFWVEKSKF